MKMIKYSWLTGLLGLLCLTSIGQQDPMFTHYMFNTQAVNPAYAGSRNALTVTGLHRSQWVGFEGAPVTQTLTLHSPIFRDDIGIGLSVVNDKLGPTRSTGVFLDLAYHLKLDEKSKLSFGLKGGFNMMQGNLAALELDEAGDQSFANNMETQVLPNVGFGVYYSREKFYVGVSTPKMLQNTFDYSTALLGTDNSAAEQRHYFVIAGFVKELDENFKIKPTTLIKVTEAAPIEVDLTAILLYKDKVWAGLMGRTGDALGILLGYQFTPQLSVGYSFDFSMLNTTGKYNAGSHELMLRYDFIFGNKAKVVSSRYF